MRDEVIGRAGRLWRHRSAVLPRRPAPAGADRPAGRAPGTRCWTGPPPRLGAPLTVTQGVVPGRPATPPACRADRPGRRLSGFRTGRPARSGRDLRLAGAGACRDAQAGLTPQAAFDLSRMDEPLADRTLGRRRRRGRNRGAAPRGFPAGATDSSHCVGNNFAHLTGETRHCPRISCAKPVKTGQFSSSPGSALLTIQSAFAETARHWERLSSNSINVPATCAGQ